MKTAKEKPETRYEDNNKIKTNNRQKLENELNHVIENLKQTPKVITSDEFDNW